MYNNKQDVWLFRKEMEKDSRELPSFILELTFFSLKICVKRSKIHDMFSIGRKMQHSHAIKGTLSRLWS